MSAEVHIRPERLTETSYHSIPIDEIVKYIKLSQSIDPQLKIVSVGSGPGDLEKILVDRIEREIICVDPKPESFVEFPNDKKKCIKPHFSTVQEMLKENKEQKDEKYILLLFWPSPSTVFFYDIEAISLLKPEVIISVYETTGAAGSDIFHLWLDKIKDVECSSHLKQLDAYDDRIQKLYNDITDPYTKVRQWLGVIWPDNVIGERQNILLCLVKSKLISKLDLKLLKGLDRTHDHPKQVSECTIM
jgi:hypothetical protein